MNTAARQGVSFDVVKMRHHMAAKGWEAKDLAAASDVSEMTVSRFLRGETQTVKTARKLALALGRTPRAYLMPAVSKTATV